MIEMEELLTLESVVTDAFSSTAFDMVLDSFKRALLQGSRVFGSAGARDPTVAPPD